MKTQSFTLSDSVTGHWLASARWGLVLLLLLGQAGARAVAQAISPSFFGINYWNPDPAGALTTDLMKADLKWLRIGGNGFNMDQAYKSASTYGPAVAYARTLKAEPLMQIPIGLTPTQLGVFVADCKRLGYNIKFWAIGNEPDPGERQQAIDWAASRFTFEGYTYNSWRNQFSALANKLKDIDPDSKLVGPDFRLFYDVANPANDPGVPSYYKRFLDDLGSAYHTNAAGQKRPLLDHFAFHFYADRTESTVQSRFETLQGLIDNVNTFGRRNNGTAAPITMAVTEVNAFNDMEKPADTKAWDFKAGQFVALMAKNLMKQGGLCFTPWSIFESGGDRVKFDYSFYNKGPAYTRRPTMWHMALLSNYRQANVMNGAQNAQQNNLVFIGMRGPDGYTLMIMNMQAATGYTYRASLDNTFRAGSEAVKIRLEAYSALNRELVDYIAPRSTHLYKLDAEGNVLSKLYYAEGDAAPRQQLAFNLVSRSSVAAGTAGHARPLAGAATSDLTQFVGNAAAISSTRWLLKPADPGYYYLVNQFTNLAMRPKGASDAERIQENQPISQEALNETSLDKDYLMWRVEYTGNGGYYRLRNKRSGKYLNVKGGGVTADLPLVQFTYFADYLSEQWRFDAAPAENEPMRARGSGPLAGMAPATGTNDALLKSFSVYPNPTAATLNISIDAEASDATLTDLTGRVCLRQALGRTGQLNLQSLAKGLYTLTVTTPAGQVRQKIVKE